MDKVFIVMQSEGDVEPIESVYAVFKTRKQAEQVVNSENNKASNQYNQREFYVDEWNVE